MGFENERDVEARRRESQGVEILDPLGTHVDSVQLNTVDHGDHDQR